MSTSDERYASESRWCTEHAVRETARTAGAQLGNIPLHPGEVVRVYGILDPGDALRASRAVELAARNLVRGYIRRAREAGMSWRAIGETMELGDAVTGGRPAATAAYDYAAGNPASALARSYGRSVPWTCPACLGTVSDKGLLQGPREDEPGHKDGCSRLAADVAAWDKMWDDWDGAEGSGQ